MLFRIIGIVKYLDIPTDFNLFVVFGRGISDAVIDLSIDFIFEFRRIICGEDVVFVSAFRFRYTGYPADGFTLAASDTENRLKYSFQSVFNAVPALHFRDDKESIAKIRLVPITVSQLKCALHI